MLEMLRNWLTSSASPAGAGFKGAAVGDEEGDEAGLVEGARFFLGELVVVALLLLEAVEE
jgi:hypothetical protein